MCIRDREKLEREIYGMEDRELPHHLMHKRKWSEYLLDFFMLFLAIFLGFLAENYRGNISDRNKETNYMIALMADLHQDITAADNCIAGNKRLIAGYESTLNAVSYTHLDVYKRQIFPWL